MKYNILKSKSWVYCFFLSFLIIFSSVSASAAVTYCSSSAFGYGSSADGGGSATPVLVSSVSELQSALNKGKNKVIIITKSLTFTKMLTVQDGSNVTLLGLPGVTLTSLQQDASNSGILYVKRFSNLIIRNLTFVGPGAYDCDGNDLLCFQDVTNAWVDHCDFQDGVDGNFDNKNGTDNVTVSWCRFRYLKAPKSGGSGGAADHRFTNLLGSSSSDKPSDGTYNITWAYCWWDDGCKERMVRCRNCDLHFLNCYWNSSVANYYVGPENAKCYFEGCTFEGKANSSSKIFKSYGGTNACKFVDCAGNLPSNAGSVSAPSYSYTASGKAEAKTAVTNATCGAGATLTVTTAGAISSTCDGGAPLPTVYTVTWDATTNGGTCGTATSSVTSGAAVGSLPEASRDGFNFDGWFTAPSGGTKISSATVVTGNVTYYAQFTSAPVTVYYTVIWDANGGTCGTASSEIESGTAVGTLPVATKTGDYTFDGWYTATVGGTKISTSTVISGNVTYYAHYTASGGGGCKTATLTHYGKQYKTDEPRRGYAYAGSLTGTKYIIESDHSYTKNVDNDSTAIRLDYSKYLKVLGPGAVADITDSLFSGITSISFKWKLYNSGSTDQTTTVDVFVGGTKVGSAIELTGKNADGFQTKTISSIASLNGAVKIKNTGSGSSSKNLHIDDISITYDCGGSTPTPPTFVLSYDENGGSGTMEDDEQTGANVIVKANGFTAPTGYAFEEWNTDMNGGGVTKTAGDVITLTEDMTLYAIWNPQSYTVTLDAGDGTGGSPSVTATFDEALPNITVPTQSGYVFKGYYTGVNGTGTQYYDENGSSTNNWTTAAATTLYAYWVAGSAPDPTGCDLHFWFIKAEDATTNSKTNDGTVFSGMVGNSSALSGNLTIDGKSYSVTGRSGDNATFGSFIIPSGKTGVFYALAVSSGSGDRQINLVCGPNTYELPVAGGSTSYKRIESEELPAGTYSIQRDGSSNVRLGVVAVKICESLSPSDAPTISTPPAGANYCAGETVAPLTIVASGSGTLSYQWKKDGVNISGANTDSYTPSESATYACIVTNAEVGESPTSVTSSDAEVTINAAIAAPVISQTDNTVSFNTATAGATIYYTIDGTDPATSSASGTSYTITADCTVKAYAVKDGCASGVTSFAATYVAEKPEPVFTWTYDASVNAGGIYSISVSSTGDADVTIEIVETITGVSGSFTAGNPATGTLTLGNYPAAETFTYRASSSETSAFKAKSETQTVMIDRCAKSDIVSYAEDITNAGDGAKPKYYCETSGVGRITKGKGSSSISTSSSTYTGEAWATKYCGSSDHSIQTYQESVFKIVLYVKSGSSTTMNTLRYSDNYIGSDGDGTDILSTSQIIYNDNPGQTHITQNTFETVTIIPPTPMNKNGFIYFKFSSSINLWGAKLYSAGGDEVTSVAFSGESEVEKYPGEAPFIKTATQTTTPIHSGGSITYKSSDESVATVNPATGEVTVLAPGRTTITAKLSAFGCFKEAAATYSVVVKNCSDPECTIAVTSGSARKCASESVTLTATAAAGAVIQWYKDGTDIPGETNSTLTTTTAGKYHATATKVCLQVSDTIEVVNLSAPTAVALHEYYYIKAGRPRPDIPLFQLTNVKIAPSSFTMNQPAPDGCSYELREDGIVYLVGTPSVSLAASTYGLTITTVNDCGFANASATLELRTLAPTARKQIAWIATGTKGQTLPGTPTASESTSHALYTYLQTYFDMTAVNAYCTTDTKKISDYCSQFDLVLLTDYPNTHVTPTSDEGKKSESYSNAFGCLVDELPLLSCEAFVADCPNWNINSNPKTPNPTQKDMTLLCAAHSIFAGTTIDVNEKIKMLSTISGNGLQGFTGLDAPTGMLNIATIDNPSGEGGTLVVCCERQKIIEARMMIMGLNYADMGNLTGDGKLVIKQIIEYLLQFEEMADCALVFDNGVNNDSYDEASYHAAGHTGTRGDGLWSTAANWHPAYNAVPKPLQAVRVDKPCQVDVTNAHCSSIRLRKDAVRGWNGNLTIHSDASLTVTDGIKEVRGKNYMTTYPSAAGDLVIQASTLSQNGSLAFGNSEDELQATVEYYSLGTDATAAKPVWQYMGIPITDGPIAIDQYHAAWMCSWESEGNVSSNWVWVENEDRIVPFKGYCITQQASKKYIHVGALCTPNKKDLTLHYFTSIDGDGFNMFANSWVAPIDIAKMRNEDFDGAEPTVYIYNTGSREQYEGGGAPSTDGTNIGAGQFNAVPVNAAPYMASALTKIPTMQGFFVQATREGKLTLDYDRICFNSTDYTTTAETMRAPRRAVKEAEEQIVPEVMRIDVSSDRFGDRVYILAHPEFSEAFDLGWDGTKQEGDENVPMLAYVQGNKLLAVAAIETPEGQYLSFRAGEDSIYTFTFDYAGETIYLYDRLADEAAEIRTGNTYTFRATNRTAINRFLITATPPRTPTQIETVGAETGDEKAEKIIYENKLLILYHGAVYDAQGARVTIGKEGAR